MNEKTKKLMEEGYKEFNKENAKVAEEMEKLMPNFEKTTDKTILEEVRKKMFGHLIARFKDHTGTEDNTSVSSEMERALDWACRVAIQKVTEKTAKEIFDELEKIVRTKYKGHELAYVFWKKEWKRVKQKFVNTKKKEMDKQSLESAKQSYANSQIEYR